MTPKDLSIAVNELILKKWPKWVGLGKRFERKKVRISDLCVQKAMLISQPPYEAQEINYTQNNRNELNFMDR